ncbi:MULTISPECIES: restriction endonuclease subunit S [Paraburkholderia]|uniref:restriction endonuclease subunit S n=1 Tax=Paraburkholderia TaxID=1822464 RepID=UPI00225407FE|nr:MULTISPECIES: restriction endonuclease subunit S [Paraburkholderia]MCX4176702.1 restriction endonuclease subunit S [Paraburkholderia madseniana]MDQ6464693.1 restriction endonuclease subunit S [Paraburkholderia madseniana]
MSLPHYPEYKDSGELWMAQVPSHWQVLKGAHIGRLFGSEAVPENSVLEDGSLPFIKVGSLSLDTLEIASWDWYVDELTAARATPRNNFIVFPKRGAAIFSNKVNIVGRPSLIDPNLMGWEIGPRAIAKFIAYSIKARKLGQLADVSTVPQINNKHIEPEKFPVPPLSEQFSIVAFLDRETNKLDALVSEQEKLLTLLAEKRQATISHAVTRGLNPSVATKDSGVAWLGQVPQHWEVKRLKHVGNAIIGLTYDPEEVATEDDGVLVLRSSNVQNGKITLEDNVYVAKDIPPKLRTLDGDILICSRNGSRNLIGKNAKLSKDNEGLTFGAFMTIFRSKFNNYLFWAFNSQVFSFQSGTFLTSTINQLTVGNLYSFEIPIPPMDEQKSIADFLERETERLDALTAEAERAIQLLKERRSALIAAAVIGKIDVRDAVGATASSADLTTPSVVE